MGKYGKVSHLPSAEGIRPATMGISGYHMGNIVAG